MKKEILTRPFPPELVKQRQGQGGKLLSYIETHAVIARLNEGCDAWDFHVERYEILDEEVFVLGKLTIEGTLTKYAFGGSSITRDRDRRPVSIADDLKSAASDALKKAASLVGVGLELYGGAALSSASSVSSGEPTPRTGQTALTADRRRGPVEGDRLTARQLAAIHAAARRRGVGPADLIALLGDRYGREGPQFLSKREASELLSEWSNGNGAHAS